MRILITNDDGITAPGLKVLEAIATEIAGADGVVWIVAPAFEQSGVGHYISYTHPMMISQMGERRFATEGSPADCVLAGLHEVMKDNLPDLVLSGVNRGNNFRRKHAVLWDHRRGNGSCVARPTSDCFIAVFWPRKP